jgi:hypothetical protein
MYWLLGSKSQPLTENKLLLYKAIIKPTELTYSIMGYDLQFEETLQRFQNKVLRITIDAL